MKLHWETEELIDCWTLLAPEQEVIANKTGVTRLGFAVLLKFSALEGQFPRSISEIPQAAVEFIAKQVAVAPEEFSKYRLHGRTASYHRTQIRELFDYQEASAEDAKRLSLWLQQKILPHETEDEHIRTAVYRQCREWRIEPHARERIERLIRSARRNYEESFGQKILSRLSPETRNSLEALLSPETEMTESAVASDEIQAAESISVATWRFIKAEPGRANAENLLTEIKRLTACRFLALPEDLFNDVPRKVLLGLRRRLKNRMNCAGTRNLYALLCWRHFVLS